MMFLAFPASSVDIVNVRDFFEHAKFNNMKLSPDGKHVAFNYQEDTEVKLAILRLSDMSILSGFAFGDNMHVVNFHWANNDRVLMEVQEVTGNLVNLYGSPVNLYAANIDGSRRVEIFRTGRSGYTILHFV